MVDVELVHKHRNVQGDAVRAAVFGISDGLVSNVGLILGVAAASPESQAVLIAGTAGLLAGAFSMAAGEYVSVKAQTELVQRELAIERASIRDFPEAEVNELASIYRSRGVPEDVAEELAQAIMVDPQVALEVHAREELGVDPDSVGDPIEAAGSSFVAFGVGAVLPLIPWLFAEGTAAILLSLLVGLSVAACVGLIIAYFTERSKTRTALRQVSLAAITCAVTWVIGSVIGSAVF